MKSANTLLGYLIPFVIIGLTIADFIPDQKVDRVFLALLLIFGLGALGLQLDNIVGRAIADKIADQLPQQTQGQKDDKASVNK